MLDQLSASRTSAVLEISLDQAIETLRRRAVNAEIRYSNHILRVLHEFDPKPPVAPPAPIPPFLKLVEPIGPNQYERHVVDPRRPYEYTFCGVDAGSWRDLGPVKQERGRIVYGTVCRRCAHSLHLAISGDAPHALAGRSAT